MSEQSIPQIIELADGTKCVRLEDFLRERDEAREKLCIASIEVNARQEIANILKERDEAREHLREIKEYGTEEINAAVELRQKLARALVDLDNMQDQRDLAMKVIKRLEQERDEARGAIRALAEHGESEIQRITKERDEWAAMGGRYKQERDEVLTRVEIEQNINANRLLTFFAANGYSRSKTLWGVGFALGHPMTAGHSMREVAHYLGCTKQAISKIACLYAGFERESNGIVTEESK